MTRLRHWLGRFLAPAATDWASSSRGRRSHSP